MHSYVTNAAQATKAVVRSRSLSNSNLLNDCDKCFEPQKKYE